MCPLPLLFGFLLLLLPVDEMWQLAKWSGSVRAKEFKRLVFAFDGVIPFARHSLCLTLEDVIFTGTNVGRSLSDSQGSDVTTPPSIS
jgi:hypothetical protein